MSNADQLSPQTAPRSRRRLGVPSVVFMIIAASAPLTVAAGGFPTSLAVTQNQGIPLAYLLVGLVLVVWSVGYAAMSRHITNAGAFYSYISQGIGRPIGVGASVVALIAYNSFVVGIYGLFGFQISSLLSQWLGWQLAWWIPVLIGIALVAILGVNQVDLSAKVLGVLLCLEFVIVVIFDVTSFAVAPEGVSAAPFAPSTLFVAGFGAVLAFSIAAFAGFEGAAIYGEESKDPKHTVARATYIAVGIIALFYSLSAWAMIVGFGPSSIIDNATSEGAGLLFGFLGSHLGVVVTDLANVLFVTSLFAALTSFHNAVARYFFSLGREGVLPSSLAKVNRRGAPYVGSLLQTGIAIVVTVIFAIIGANWVPPEGLPAELFPVVTMFSWLTNNGGLGLVLLMAIVSIAVVGFFAKNQRDATLWQRAIAPIIAAVALLGIFVFVIANFNVLLTSDPTAPPTAATFVLPAIAIVPGIIAAIWGLYLRNARPQVYSQIGHGTEGAGAPQLAATED
ncbi:MAG TPA: APC family permease [Pseudolysinimonas sp.]|nr:APC family permease [Pseudolysinimonas sp.]